MADISSYIRTDFKAVDKREELRNVMGWVTGDSSEIPIVTDDGRAFGIVNDRAMMGRRLDQHAKVNNYTLTTRALAETTTPEEAMARMAEFRAPHLPVETKGKLSGYVSALDLARGAGGNGKSAGDACVPVRVLKLGETLGDALHAFHNEYIDHLPVADAEGRVVGVLGRRDILRLEAGTGHGRGRRDAGHERQPVLQGPIDGWITPARYILRTTDQLDKAFDLIEESGYAVVCDANDTFVGIVTPQTLARHG